MPRNPLQGSGGNHRFGWFYEHPEDAAGIVLNGQSRFTIYELRFTNEDLPAIPPLVGRDSVEP